MVSPPLFVIFGGLSPCALDDFIRLFDIAAGSTFNAFDTPVALASIVALEMAVTNGDKFTAAVAVTWEFIAGQW